MAGMTRTQAESILGPVWQGLHLAKDRCHQLMEEAREADPCNLGRLYSDALEALTFIEAAERRFDPIFGLLQAIKANPYQAPATWPNALPADEAPRAAVLDLLRQRPALAARVQARTDREAAQLAAAMDRLRPVASMQRGA